jgi:hypothetical protein
VVTISATAEGDTVSLRLDAPVGQGDWPDATLLDLRLSSFVAAMHDAELCIDGAP